MYVNDPFDLTLEPQIEGWDDAEETDEDGPDYSEIFHSEFRHYPGNTSYHRNFAVDMCRFDQVGNHTQMGANCPHFEQEDEEGPRIRPGWTVQQNK